MVAYALTVGELVDRLTQQVVYPAMLFLFALAMFWFFYGFAKFFFAEAEDSSREEGKQHMLYGVIGLAIMLSVYGILQIICGTFSCA